MKQKTKSFKTNSFLTLVTGNLFFDGKKNETAEEILIESIDIISYMIEDIPNDLLIDLDINNVCVNQLIGSVDPIIIEIAKETNNNDIKNKIILNKLLGPTVPIKKIDIKSIKKINDFKQKKKTINK